MPAKAGIQYEPTSSFFDIKRPCVYIVASRRNGTVYIGVTGDIRRRAWLVKPDATPGFIKRYGVHRLVYLEFHDAMLGANRARKAA